MISGRRAATSIYSGNRSCTRVYVDGSDWGSLQAGDLDMIVNPDDVIGLEVYQPGDVPNRFRNLRGDCLTLVVWTQFRKAKK